MTATAEAPPDVHEQTLEEERKEQVPPEQLALPMIDGRAIDVLELQVTGTVKLDRSDPEDCKLIRRLRLGAEVDLKMSVCVSGSGGKISRDEDGYAKDVTLKKTLTVTGVARPAGEQLDLEADAD